jgi:hypothetical protein
LEKSKSVPPSVDSFAILLENEPEILQRLKDTRTAAFFEILGVNPAALMLKTLGHSEPERMALIQSLAIITSAVGNNAETVQRLAGAIQADSKLITLIEERQAISKRVATNQALGELAEKTFEEAFRDTGLTVTRTGPGHDYKFEAPDGLNDAGKVVLSGLNKPIFVEIKATTTEEVHMSVLQAQEAVSNEESYVLCVIVVPAQHMDAAGFKAQARFVTNIGSQLKGLWEQYQKVAPVSGTYEAPDGKAAIEVQSGDVRFCIRKELWANALDFSAVLTELRNKLIVTTG